MVIIQTIIDIILIFTLVVLIYCLNKNIMKINILEKEMHDKSEECKSLWQEYLNLKKEIKRLSKKIDNLSEEETEFFWRD